MKQHRTWPLRLTSLLILLCILVTTALAGAQPGGTAQPGTVDQLPDPLAMSRISMGLRIAFMDYYRGESLPDFFGGFYYNADGTVVMCLTDTSEAVLEEIRTAFYSYHDGRNPEHFDKWLPTVQITEVKYSFEQLFEVETALRDALAEADCGEYITQIDFESNRVVAFCETDEGLALAATYAQPEDILLVQPMEDYEAWWTYATRNTIRFSESAAAEQPEEPESVNAGGVMPGMKNTFRRSQTLVSSGTVGFCAYLTYEGSNNNSFGLRRGDSVEAIFTHGHDIEMDYPYSTIADGVYSAQLLYCNPAVDFSFYQLTSSGTISSKRYGSPKYFADYCADEDALLEYYHKNIYFYGVTSSEQAIRPNKIGVDSGGFSWADSSAVSQPGDSGGPIYVCYTDSGGVERLKLLGIMRTNNSGLGGEAQTIYNIITDVEFSDDFAFDALCLY